MAKKATKLKRKPAKRAVVTRQSSEDRKHLAAFNKRHNMLAAIVEAVAEKTLIGLVVYGPPGLGKTTTVRKTLDKLKCKYEYRNGCGTARGLYELIRMFPDSILVFDDLHSLLTDPAAMQILLAATGDARGKSRPVTYTKSGSDPDGDVVNFSGGIIAISNLPIPATAMGHAFANRVRCFGFSPTPDELAAVMRDNARDGYRDGAGRMTPTECGRVVNFVLKHAEDEGIRVDFRTVYRAYKDYLICKNKKRIDWEEMVLDDMTSAARPQAPVPVTKKEQLEVERQQLIEMRAKHPELSLTEAAKRCDITKSKAYGLLPRK